jgi:hypothetical protein
MSELYAREPLKATVLDDNSFRLLAIPFGGPIPSPLFPRGIDIDGETFTERTDVKAAWFDSRPTDWHHGADPTGKMGRAVLGKAVDLGPFDGKGIGPDADGWWVTVWLDQGQKRLDLIRRLASQATIYGSSESVPGLTKKASSGEILVWPYIEQTLTTFRSGNYPIDSFITDFGWFTNERHRLQHFFGYR